MVFVNTRFGASGTVPIVYILLYTAGLLRCQEKPDINIMGFLPMTGKMWYGGGACLPPIQIALQIANKREDILPHYNIRFLYRDGQCNAGHTANLMYEMLYEPPVKHMISGPGCSVAAEATGTMSPYWNLTHISWAAASPLISDRVTYSRFFRLIPPDTQYNEARVKLFQHFNWRKVAIISVAMDFFFAVIDDFRERIRGTEITITTQEIFYKDPTSSVTNLKKQDARIIMSGSYENHARLILCAAYRVGLYGPNIVWIFPGWFSDYWWRVAVPGLPCTSEEMDVAAEGQLQTGFIYQHQRVEERGSSGINVLEFWERFWSHPDYRPELSIFEFVSGPCFDHAWGAALALNCTETYLKETGHNKTLADFTYADSDIGDVITSCTNNLTFLGISGYVNLTQGDPLRAVKISQVRGLMTLTVGIYNSHTGETSNQNETDDWYIDWVEIGIEWRGGYVPRDSTHVTELEVTIPWYLYTIMSCVAAIGILLSLMLIVFNVHHRNTVVVKLSSPNINNVLLLGCICTYSTVFMYSYITDTTSLCKLRTFVFSIGFSMAFGALFSKTWRVFKIFSNKKLQKLKIQDSQLIGVVGLLIAVLSAVLVLWEIIDARSMVTQFLDSEVYNSGNDAVVRPYLRHCESRYEIYFTWTIYVIEGVLLMFGAFLSFQTRKVKVAALNDSHQIGMCLYNVIVLVTIALTLTLVLHTQVALLYGVTSGFIIIGTTATQLIVFIPKINAVYNPNRVDVQGTGQTGGSTIGVVGGLSGMTSASDICTPAN